VTEENHDKDAIIGGIPADIYRIHVRRDAFVYLFVCTLFYDAFSVTPI
jgi:hypothetical protein